MKLKDSFDYIDIEYRRADGKLHREDGPAVKHLNGYEEWWFDGKLHKNDGPAMDYGTLKVWWNNGKIHRKNGPAICYKNFFMWVYDNKIHRENGPAIYTQNYKEWWVHGKQYNWFSFHCRRLKKIFGLIND